MIKSLQCEIRLGSGYKSSAQIARVVTEHWCGTNLYCVACQSESLSQTPTNTHAVDFRCSGCLESYQLKSQRRLNLRNVPDGAYRTMLSAVKQNSAPNLLILNYSPQWSIAALFLIPAVFFTESVLQRRAPLSPTARRAGWVGCNILLSNVPDEAKIPIIRDARIVSPDIVRRQFQEYQRLRSINWNLRGWTLDVLRVARRLGHQFTLREMYEHETTLLRLHPGNHNIRAKIRQQLQVLRDLDFIEFVGRGQYAFRILSA
ncbi:MAG TPA: DpnI domain-containing protein [Candidatus Saccharimonadales bacterium]|jgi:type II restriction enzyme|nr:DpnI domain-containing protein [Candidatus Saccharimonadales bacterium]